MCSNKRLKNREWFEQKIAEMGESLKRLPVERQDLLDSFDGGKDAGAAAPENIRHTTPKDIKNTADSSENNNNPGAVSDIRAFKCNPINSRGRGREAAVKPTGGNLSV